jgi:Flp pilus assembly protein TadD
VLHGRRSLPLEPRRGLGLVVALALIACGSAPRAKAASMPAAATRDAIARADEHERARHHDLARAEYQRAVAAAPDPISQVYARREYASALAFWGEIAAAVAELDIVVRLAPDDAPSWHDLGILRHQQGDDDGAAIALERARALAPRDPRPRIALAALRWQTGDRAGAAREYRALLALELPSKVRARVEWALAALARQP